MNKSARWWKMLKLTKEVRCGCVGVQGWKLSFMWGDQNQPRWEGGILAKAGRRNWGSEEEHCRLQEEAGPRWAQNRQHGCRRVCSRGREGQTTGERAERVREKWEPNNSRPSGHFNVFGFSLSERNFGDFGDFGKTLTSSSNPWLSRAHDHKHSENTKGKGSLRAMINQPADRASPVLTKVLGPHLSVKIRPTLLVLTIMYHDFPYLHPPSSF